MGVMCGLIRGTKHKGWSGPLGEPVPEAPDAKGVLDYPCRTKYQRKRL